VVDAPPPTFQVTALAGEELVWGENAWDTAELMTAGLDAEEVVFIDPTPTPASGLHGITSGGVVYHYGGITLASDGGVTPDALQNWRQALSALGVRSDDL
jgi:hypothetical protein